jgi:hypothetical protein
LSPATKPFTLRTLIVVAPALAFAESDVRLDCVPTFVTVTVSIPWPTLSMSSLILSPGEMFVTDVTLMLVAPGTASAPRNACVPALPTSVTVATSYRSIAFATAG